MKTYKLSFELKSPISITFPKSPTFDGVLSYGYVVEIYRNLDFRKKYIEAIKTEKNQKHIEYVKKLPVTTNIIQKMNYIEEEIFDFSLLPLCKKHDYFLASSLIIPKISEERMEFIRKKYDSYNARYTSINKNRRINSGQDKNIQIEMPLRIINKIEFIIATQDINSVLQLLKHIKGFGKKRNIQYGQFSSVNYTEVKNYDWEIINRPIPEEYVSEKMLKKTLNQKNINSVSVFYVTYKPNYWLSEPKLCYLPII